MDPSMDVTEDENIKAWVLDEDRVLVKMVVTAVGMDGLAKLVAIFKGGKEWLHEAR